MAQQISEAISMEVMNNIGLKAVQQQPIDSLSAWIDKQYKTLRFVSGYHGMPALVDSGYAYVMFLNEIMNEQIDTLLDISSLASAASTQYINCKMWEVEAYQCMNQDHELFVKWSAAVDAKLQSKGLVLEFGALDKLISAIECGDLNVSESVSFFGFDSYPPKVTRLIGALKEKGCQIEEPFYIDKQAKEFVQASKDEVAQYRDVAQMAYNLYTLDNQKRVAIVHPSLHEPGVLEKLTFELTNVFEPQYALPQTNAYVRPFNISFGHSLLNAPIMQTAVALLKLLSGPMAVKDVITFIQSPFIKNDKVEENHRKKLVKNLVAAGYVDLDLEQLIKRSNSAPLLNAQLRRVKQYLSSSPALGTPSQWVNIMIEALNLVGWAKGRKLNSFEYQAYMKLSSCVDGLKTHDIAFGEMTYESALKVFFLYMNQNVFKAEVDKNCPIVVLGALEAGGLDFDQVILMNMDNTTWPKVAEPSSFLPESIQKEYDMPHSSPERELAFTKAVTSRIKQASEMVIYAYYEQAMGEKNEPSFVVQGNPVPELLLRKPDIVYKDSEYRRMPCRIVDDNVDPIADGKQRGGTGFIEDVMQCDFKAYIKHHMNVKADIKYGQGLNPLEQGNLLHSAIENFWDKHRSQKALLEMTEQQLVDEVIEALEVGFFDLERGHLFSDEIKNLEINQMSQSIIKQLEAEKLRPNFVVADLETKKTITLAGLEINIRIDRTDMVDINNDGKFDKKLVIDNKGGAVSLKGMGEIVTKPQLPVYALSDTDIDAVGYSSYKNGEERVIGIGKESLMDGIKAPAKAVYGAKLPSSFDETKAVWKAYMEDKIEEYKKGALAIKPVNKAACLTCEYSSLCRKNAK